LSTEDDFANDFKDVPCKHNQRLEAVRGLFMRMGASESEITTAKFRGAENLVVKRKGLTDETIIIGAHYDFADLGCGAIDNWSGIVTMSHIYKSVRGVEQKKTVLFVAFDNEEKGLVGARAMANAIAKEDLPRYCAMINIDSFGQAPPFAMTNTSSASLIRVAEDAATALRMPFYSAPINGADADSSAFLARKIPAVTFAGIGPDWPSILHTVKDQKAKVDAQSAYMGYKLALAVWDRVDQAECGRFRDASK
jgi:acetylornithine deacetylase/succinyl-diaminopimelate desuccinylase-like protein